MSQHYSSHCAQFISVAWFACKWDEKGQRKDVNTEVFGACFYPQKRDLHSNLEEQDYDKLKDKMLDRKLSQRSSIILKSAVQLM